MKKMICLLALVALISGCATMPTQEQIANMDYGTPPTINCETVIKEYLSKVLFDPYSAVYEGFTTPQKYWYKEPFGKLYSGYVVFVKINAKNQMGGYVGIKPFGFIFKDDVVIKVIQPEEFEYQALSGKPLI